MKLKWTSKAMSDLYRIAEFLASSNKSVVSRTVQSLISGSMSLLANPRIGEKLEEFVPRKVRRILIGDYEIGYEIQVSVVYILRIWHTREKR